MLKDFLKSKIRIQRLKLADLLRKATGQGKGIVLFPHLGIKRLNTTVPYRTTSQIDTSMKLVAAKATPGESKEKKKAVTDYILNDARNTRGLVSGMRTSGPEPFSQQTFHGGIRTGDPKDSRTGDYGTEVHENQHSAFDEIGKLHGAAHRQLLAHYMVDSLPEEHKKNFIAFTDHTGANKAHPTLQAEERITALHSFLNSSENRKQAKEYFSKQGVDHKGFRKMDQHIKIWMRHFQKVGKEVTHEHLQQYRDKIVGDARDKATPLMPQTGAEVKKHIFSNNPVSRERIAQFHGWISPKGEFHQMSGDKAHPNFHGGPHEDPFRVSAKAYNDDWISVGHGGFPGIRGHKRVLEDSTHPATKKLRQMVSDLHPDFTRVHVMPMTHVDNGGFGTYDDEHDVPRHLAERGNFKKPSETQLYRSEDLTKEIKFPTSVHREVISPKGEIHKPAAGEEHGDTVMRLGGRNAHKEGWIEVGKAGEPTVLGHPDILNNPSHPSTKAAAKRVQEFPQDKELVSVWHNVRGTKDWFDVPRKQAEKGNFKLPSRTQFYRSEDMAKEMFGISDPAKIKQRLKFHGFISPKGEFHPMGKDEVHAQVADKLAGPDLPNTVHGEDHLHENEWLSVGTSGAHAVKGHSSVLNDPTHPATKKLAELVREQGPEDAPLIEIAHSDTHKVHHVKHELAAKGRFRKLSPTQEFHQGDDFGKAIFSGDVEERMPFHGLISPEGVFHQVGQHEYHSTAALRIGGRQMGETMGDFHKRGWIEVGTAGENAIRGHKDILHNPSHPATRELARRVAALHPKHTKLDIDASDDYYTVPRSSAEKARFIKQSPTAEALSMSVREKLNMLKVVLSVHSSGTPVALNPEKAHGWISPEGEYHPLDPQRGHYEWAGNKGHLPEAFHEKGWLSIGHGGESNVQGHAKYLHDPHHPATRTARKLAGEHFGERTLLHDSTKFYSPYPTDENAGSTKWVHTKTWAKHGNDKDVNTSPMLAFRSSIQEKLNILKIAMSNPPLGIENFHGWVSPEGQFHKVPTNQDHDSWLKREKSVNPISAYKKGWMSIGHGGRFNVRGHESHVLNRSHPATQTVARLARQVPSDKDYEVVHEEDRGFQDIYNVPAKQVHTGNLSKPSKVAAFHSGNVEKSERPLIKRELDPKEGVSLTHEEHGEEGFPLVRAWKKGKCVGRMHYYEHQKKPGFLEVGFVEVAKEHRRKGIASAMYQHVEKLTGKKLAPSAARTQWGRKLWSQPNRKFGKSENIEKYGDSTTDIIPLGPMKQEVALRQHKKAKAIKRALASRTNVNYPDSIKNSGIIEPVIKSFQPNRAKAAGDIEADVDPKLFDKEWAKDPDFHVGEGGKGGIGNRYEKVKSLIGQGVALPQPEISIREGGKVGFSDGRHRFAVMRDMGHSKIRVSLSADSLPHIKPEHGITVVKK